MLDTIDTQDKTIQQNLSASRDFFETLYGTAEPDDGSVVLYRKTPHRLEFYDPDDVEALAGNAATLGWRSDCYFHVNLCDPDAAGDIQARHGRMREDEVAGVVALVIDVDVSKEHATGGKYPPQDVARAAIEAMPKRPTMITLSGGPQGGLHVYYCLHEPERIETPEDLVRVKNISKRWQALFKDKLKDRSPDKENPYALDSTFDLGRVLRPVGTKNHKYGSTVTPLVMEPDRRYELDDFEPFLPEVTVRPSDRQVDYAALANIPRGSIADQARRYVSKIDPAVSGDGRQHKSFRVAAALIQGFALTVDEAWPIFSEWNDSNDPPLAEHVARNKLIDADKRDGGRGYLVAGIDDGADLELFEEDTREVRSLADWRDEMVGNRLESLGRPGLYADCSPTGSGKSYADRQAMRAAEKSLTLLPDHSNCNEQVAELIADGFDAAAYPRLDETLCKEHDQVALALECGLPPATAVCPGCSSRESCVYQVKMKQAKRADHAFACHARAAQNFTKLAKGKRFVAVHENAAGMLRPTISFSKPKMADLPWLDDVAAVAGECRKGEVKRADYGSAIDMDLVNFTDFLQQAAIELQGAYDRATETTGIPITLTMRRPKGLSRRLFRAIRKCDGRPSADAMKTCIGLVTGEVESVTIDVRTIKVKGGVDQVRKSIVAVWKTALPATTIWFADATASVETLEKLTGETVIDKTPAGRLEYRAPVRQIARDITRGTSTAIVAATLRGVLAQHPEAEHVGVIGHSPHIKDLLRGDNPLLDAGTRGRIAMTAYFGEGPERSSNAWQERCDLVVVLGTPRPPVSAVRDHLLACGQSDAAGRDGEWGKRRWQGQTVAGGLVTVDGIGYGSDDWRSAHGDLVIAELQQCVGRGRAILEDGIPVVVLSNEPLGLPVAEDTLPRVTDQMVRVADAVRECAGSGSVTTAEVVAVLDIARVRTQQILKDAEALGLVHRGDARGTWKAPAYQVSPVFVTHSPKSTYLGKSVTNNRQDSTTGKDTTDLGGQPPGPEPIPWPSGPDPAAVEIVAGLAEQIAGVAVASEWAAVG